MQFTEMPNMSEPNPEFANMQNNQNQNKVHKSSLNL